MDLMQPKQSKWSKRSGFLDVIDVSCVFLRFSFLIFGKPSSVPWCFCSGPRRSFFGCSDTCCNVHKKMSLIFHASKCSSWERQKTKGCGPNGLGGLSKLKFWIVLRYAQLSWSKSCLRWWKNMQAEQVARIWKQVWPNWPVSIWLMIDLMTAFHVTSCYIFPFLTRFGWVFVFHITVCLYYASVLHLAVTSWNSTARQQMTAG